MKTLYTLFIYLLAGTGVIFAQQQTTSITTNKNVPDFEKWTEEQILHWEDSVIKALYPEPVIQSIEMPAAQLTRAAIKATAAPLNFTNNHVPNSYPVDKTKDVGEIPMSSSVSPSGSMAYNIPIEMAPGRQGFQPQLSVTYNSLAGNGVMGAGWNIAGLSSIMRTGRSIYYDGKSQGIALNKDDAFVLDGTRLIKLSETASQINYETEQGLIKVKAFLSGSIVLYFEVDYPNGNKGVFGLTYNTSNRLSYPLTSLKDLRGNAITYSYTLLDNHYYISTISYAGASVSFQYATTRPDPVTNYEGGTKVTMNRLLEKIYCFSNNIAFRTYEFGYLTKTTQNASTLNQIGCTANGKSLNPLRFYYGEGNTAVSFTKAETQLLEWYVNAQPGQLRVSKGKFDYGTDNDGLISLPNKNPYWSYFRNKTWLRDRHHQYQNHYSGTEKIFLYAGLNDSYAAPMPNLTTEAGFTDIFTANIDGKYEEEVIKVNNTISGSSDRLQFKVYTVNLYTGLALKYTRAYNFSTILTDEDNNKSIHPKFHFTGDFNGDGKIEVLSVSNNHPFGWTDKPTRCYLFDLDTGAKLYEGTPFAFYKEFLGDQQGDATAAAQNSDRLFAFDYDGDGKTDICLINDNGTHFYTFDITGSTYSVRQVSSYTTLNKSTLQDRELLIGEFNGDGKPDFLLTTKSSTSDWLIYYAKGNGQFERTAKSITSKSSTDEILLQDVNSDGLTDVIKKIGTSGFYIYLTKPGTGYSSESYTSFPYSGSLLVPTDINSRNHFHQLVALKDGKVTRFSFPRNDTKEKQLTGAVNSLGVVSKTYYKMLNEADYYYAKGYGAVYPFENFHGSFSVPVSMEQYVNGQRNENMEYRYENAVIHKQGRGFCGFGKVVTYDNTRGMSYTQEFDPYNFGISKVNESPTAKITNTWSVSVQTNKIAKVRLSNTSSLDKLSNQTATSAYVYDTYGNVTKETVTFGGGVTKVTDQTYYHSTSGSIYLIGQPVTKTITNTRGGASWIDKETYTYNEIRLPLTRITYTGTAGSYKTGETRWGYDTNWNVTSEISAPYNVTEFLGNTYTYDSSGKYLASVTNALSQTTKYSNYDAYGNPKTVTDYKDNVTTRNYNGWGQLVSISNPDGTTESTTVSWGGAGLFIVTNTATGSPAAVNHYDALGREVRSGNQRFDGQWQYVDKAYDSRGRLEKLSLPFKGGSPSLWNTYSYDTYNRPTKLAEASGKTTTWSYSGLSVTIMKDSIASTQTKDASGALVSVTDPGGTITYALRPDGQPSSITAPGSVVTSFGYDAYGRQTSIADPSAGTQTFSDVFTADGVLTRTVKDANNKTITSTYDKYGRVTAVTRPEFNTTYKYKGNDTSHLLDYEESNNGTRIDFVEYDTFDRIKIIKETAPDNKYLQKRYSYSGGNVDTVQYVSQNGTIATETLVYAYGHNTEIKLGATSIWKLTEENALGQPTKATTGELARTYGYTAYGMPTGRTAGSIQNFTYDFDVIKGNLKSRKDNARNITETFGYDNLNRLINAAGKAISYSANGNITSMAGVGTMEYTHNGKPYQISLITPTGDAVPARVQTASYTSFQRPATLAENGYNATFTYNAAGDRVKMHLTQGSTAVLTRYYIGGQYEIDAQSNTERLYLGGDAYSAPAVYVKEANNWNIYYICRDYLGSITHVANANGSLKQEISYDAWGRLRNPATQVAYTPGSEPALFLGRGYTGHEHLPWFGLVNMNARLYDAALGRFLSPDPYVQSPGFTQNFNRYSYCLNNPLVYVDKNGEFFFIPILVGMAWGALIGAATSAVIYTAQVGITSGFKDWNIMNFGKAVLMGGVGGAIGGGLGALGSQIGTFGQTLGYNILSNVASNSATTIAFGGEVTWGSLAGSVAGGVLGAKIGGFSGVKGGALKNIGAEMAFGIGKGAATGGAGGAIGAAIDGKNVGKGFWDGVKNGAIAGGTVAGLNIAAMGAAYKPKGSYGDFGKNGPVYRRGTFITRAFFRGGGITIGRNLVVNKYNENKLYQDENGYILNTAKLNQNIEAHETGHYVQQQELGFANFYGKVFTEYLKYGFKSSYCTPGSLEWNAEEYAIRQVGSLYLP